MKALDIVKGVANVATGLGVGKTVDLILKENLPIDMNWKARLATFIGSAVISGYISAKCTEYVEGEIDNVHDTISKIKDQVKIEASKEDGEHTHITVEMTD